MLLDCNEKSDNRECRFIVMMSRLSNVDPGPGRVLYYIVVAIEIFTLAFLVFLTFVSLPIVFKSAKFHLNIMRIVIFFIAHLCVLAACRSIILLFQMNIFSFEDDTSISRKLLVFTSAVHMYELYVGPYCFFGFVIERIFATAYVRDYEHSRRDWISTFLIIAILIICSANGVACTFGLPGLSVYTSHQVVMLSTLIVTFFMLAVAFIVRRLNIIYITRLNYLSSYPLSEKFQLAENLRAFKLLMNIGKISVTGVVIGTIVFNATLADEDKSRAAIYGELFQLSHEGPIAIALTFVLYSRPQWRLEIAHKFGLQRWIVEEPVLPSHQAAIASDVTNAYFQELNRAWD